MKNSKTLFLDLVNQIKIEESHDEIQSMVYILLENLFSISRTDIMSEKEVSFGQAAQKEIAGIIQRINHQEPIQYIVGETEFYGRNFKVNPSVLIPRPETEELVRLILNHLDEAAGVNDTHSLVDIGTGTGCIAITLALEIARAEVFATDVSSLALEVASKNALDLKANVQFIVSDILKEEIPWQHLDLVVSNPPYITRREMEDMKKNIVSHEPHLALFVPDDNPLLFYKSIAEKAARALRKKGLLVIEINECFGRDVANLLAGYGFEELDVVRDLFGKERIVKGILS